MSEMGDFFGLFGTGVIHIWTRDDIDASSYNSEIFFSTDKSKAVLSSVVKEYPDLGTIIESDISSDGRLIATL